jgi:hypothetical protein
MELCRPSSATESENSRARPAYCSKRDFSKVGSNHETVAPFIPTTVALTLQNAVVVLDRLILSFVMIKNLANDLWNSPQGEMRHFLQRAENGRLMPEAEVPLPACCSSFMSFGLRGLSGNWPRTGWTGQVPNRASTGRLVLGGGDEGNER